MLFKEYCILPFYQNRANQGIVINKKSSYCKDRVNQGRANLGLTVNLLFFELAIILIRPEIPHDIRFIMNHIWLFKVIY